MQSRVIALLLALAAGVAEVAAERRTVSLTKADQLQQLLGKQLSAEAGGVFAALADELGRYGEASWNPSTHAAATGVHTGGRDADVHLHMASRKAVRMEKAMALAQSIEKGGVDAAQKEVAQLLLNGTAQKAKSAEGVVSLAAAEAEREVVQANVTLIEQKDKKCRTVYKKFLKQKERLLTQVTKIEKRQHKPSRNGKRRQPGLLTLGRIGRAFLGVTSAEEKARQADPAGSCGIDAADHEELKEGMRKVHPCWPKVQESARKQAESVSEEEKQEAFIRLTNIILSCKEPSEAQLEIGKEAIRVHGGDPEEIAKAGALEMQQKATEVSKLELELLDDDDEEEDEEEEEEEEEDDGAEASLSLLEQELRSHGGAEVSFTSAGETSAFAAANADLLARAQAQVDTAVRRLGELLESGDEQQAASLARGLLLGRSTGDEGEIVMLILGAIFYAFAFALCGGPVVLWFLLGWIVCIIYKALSLVVRVAKQLLQLSTAISSSSDSASIWGCYTGGLDLLTNSSASAGSLTCGLIMITR